jgi:small subunit ribosomal protein S3
MGQKIHPHGLRVGVIKDWDTRWISKKKDFADYLKEDYDIRKFLKEKLYTAGISKIVNIFASKPGIIIGKGGTGVDLLKAEVAKRVGKVVNVNIMEVRKPDIDAQLVAESIAAQLEKRISFRRAMKQSIGRAMKGGAQGIKTMCAGRLGGAEIARSERYHEGSIPLQTIRADIEYGFAEAHTTYGRIGVKVWIYKGQILGDPLKEKHMNPEGGRKNVNAKKS